MIDFKGATFDSRQVMPGMLFVALKGEKVDGHDYIPKALEKGAAGVVDGLEELKRVALEYRKTLKAKVVGVTGSAGKTTTKELLKAFLSQLGSTYATEGNFNNHIGLPITILNCPKDADFLVVEMGSNHPGEIAALCDIALPDVGVVTNVGSAHLEFFKTREGIAEEKGTLLKRAALSFSHSDSDLLPGSVGPAPAWLKEAMSKVLPGEHNLKNAALAFAVAEAFALTPEKAVSALENFALPGARWRKSELNGVKFIDDTYNANPDSMKAALKTFATLEGRKIAILGDMFELGETSEALHKEVFDFASTLGLDKVLAVGKTSSKCRACASFETVEELKAALPSILKSGDNVLLKASHSMNLGAIL